MSTPRSDELLFAASGDVWEKYGTFVKRTLPEEERGSFSRSSDATYTDRSGNLRTAESGVLRPHYVSSESSYSARLEAARTNSILHSEEFDHADWTNEGTLVADDAVAPDGTLTADKTVDDSGTNTEGASQTVAVADDSLNRAASLFVKKKSSDATPILLQLAFTGGTTIRNYWAELDPVNGTVDTANSPDAPTDAGVEEVGDYWRVWLVGANNSMGNTSVELAVWPGSITGTDTNAEFHIWGAQLEGVSGGARFPSSYIATTDSAVTRAGDDASVPMSYGPQGATHYGKLNLRSLDENVVLRDIGTSGDAGGIRVEMTASNDLKATLFGPSATATSTVSLSPSFDDTMEYRVVVADNGDLTAHAALNGGAESSGSTDTSADLPTSFGTQDTQLGAEQDGSRPSSADHIEHVDSPGTRSLSEMQAVEV